MARARREWTEGKRETFLDALADNCNVRQSSAAAGMDPRRVYALKRRDPAFAEELRGALAVGYARIEARLLRDAEGLHGPGEAPLDKDERYHLTNLLKLHQATVNRAHAGGTPLRRATEAETDAAILRKLAALRRRLDS